jgi:hypothetical protein
MARYGLLRRIWLTRFSRPAGERRIYRHAIRRPPRRIIEIGVGTLARTTRLLELVGGLGDAQAEGYSIVVIILACEEMKLGELVAAAAYGYTLSPADVVFFELGMGSIPWLIGGEMLPEAPRATAMGVAAAVNWVFTTVIGLGFPPVSKALGNYAFVPFAAVLVVTFIFTLNWVPETKGRTPEQVLAWIATGSYDATLPPKQLRGGDDDEETFLTRGGLQ